MLPGWCGISFEELLLGVQGTLKEAGTVGRTEKDPRLQECSLQIFEEDL